MFIENVTNDVGQPNGIFSTRCVYVRFPSMGGDVGGVSATEDSRCIELNPVSGPSAAPTGAGKAAESVWKWRFRVLWLLLLLW